MTGATGSGKSTTGCDSGEYQSLPQAHIVTVEDPSNMCSRTTARSSVRGDWPDEESLELRAAFRQDPDVILVGEIRDMETAEQLFSARAGHLVISTLLDRCR